MHFMWKFNANVVIKSLNADFVPGYFFLLSHKILVKWKLSFYVWYINFRRSNLASLRCTMSFCIYTVSSVCFQFFRGVFRQVFFSFFLLFLMQQLGLSVWGDSYCFVSLWFMFVWEKCCFSLPYFARQRIEKEMDKTDQWWVYLGTSFSHIYTHTPSITGKNFNLSDISKILHHILFIFIWFHIGTIQNDLCPWFWLSKILQNAIERFLRLNLLGSTGDQCALMRMYCFVVFI